MKFTNKWLNTDPSDSRSVRGDLIPMDSSSTDSIKQYVDSISPGGSSTEAVYLTVGEDTSYTTLKAATDYVTAQGDASASKRYIILLQAGEHEITTGNNIVFPGYTSIIGRGKDVSRIKVSSTSGTPIYFANAPGAEFHNLTLTDNGQSIAYFSYIDEATATVLFNNVKFTLTGTYKNGCFL